MRPVISEEMVDRIESLDEHHGYESAAEFIRDAVRRRLDTLEEKKRRYELRAKAAAEIEQAVDVETFEIGPEDVVINDDGNGGIITISEERQREVARAVLDESDSDE